MAYGLFVAILLSLALAGFFSILYEYLPNLKNSELSSKPITTKDILSNAIIETVIKFSNTISELNKVEDDYSEQEIISNLKKSYLKLQEMADHYDEITGQDPVKDQLLDLVDSRGRHIRLLLKNVPMEDVETIENEDEEIGEQEEVVELFWFIERNNSSHDEESVI